MITHKMREFLDYKAGKLVDKIVNQFSRFMFFPDRLPCCLKCMLKK